MRIDCVTSDGSDYRDCATLRVRLEDNQEDPDGRRKRNGYL
jgi:hypothetical protein